MQGFDALRFGVFHLRGIGPGTLELSVWLQRSLAAVLNPARRAPPDMGHTAASLGRPAQGTGGYSTAGDGHLGQRMCDHG